jgi:serine/threonine protein kinase
MAIEPLTAGDPAQVAGYRLHGRLGAGGMGVVYLAYTPGGRPVALKVVRPELGSDPQFRRRFRHEVDAAQRVHSMYTACQRELYCCWLAASPRRLASSTGLAWCIGT